MKLPCSNQQGFAPIALVMLLLFGIAAGVILVQQGTNLIPQAAEPGDWDWPFRCDQVDVDNATTQSAANYASACPTEQYPKFNHCDTDLKSDPNDKPIQNSTSRASCASFTQNFNVTFYCRWNTKCSTGPAPAVPLAQQRSSCTEDQNTSCGKEGTGVSCKSTSNKPYCLDSKGFLCFGDSLHSVNNLVTPVKNCQSSSSKCGFDKNAARYDCISQPVYDAWRASLTTPAAAAPAAQLAPALPEVPVTKCNLSCPSPSLGCFKIEGKERCVFPGANDLSCPPSETAWCKAPTDVRDGCEVARAIIVDGQTKNDVKFTRCTASKTGAGAPATDTTPKGTAPIAPSVQSGTPTAATAPKTCKDAAGTERAQGKYYKCDNKACTGGTVGVPFICNPTGDWTTPNMAGECIPETSCTASFTGISTAATTTGTSTTASSNANIPCSDANQMINGIPCYKIGVFDDATREQIEKNARIASNNYKIYEQVLKELGSLMDANAKTKADQALKSAQTAAACISGTSTTATNTTATSTSTHTTTSSGYPTSKECESTCNLNIKACLVSKVDNKFYCIDPQTTYNKNYFCVHDYGVTYLTRPSWNQCPADYPTCDSYGQCKNSSNQLHPGTINPIRR